eukprot:2198593-Prymnesium_polylepis.1
MLRHSAAVPVLCVRPAGAGCADQVARGGGGARGESRGATREGEGEGGPSTRAREGGGAAVGRGARRLAGADRCGACAA